MKTLAVLYKEKAAKQARLAELAKACGEDGTEEQLAEIQALRAECAELEAEIAEREGLRAQIRQEISAVQASLNAADLGRHEPRLNPSGDVDGDGFNAHVIPKGTVAYKLEEEAKRRVSPAALKLFKERDKAALAGHFMGALRGDQSCIDAVGATYMEPEAVMNTTQNEAGGYLVPQELSDSLIDLRENFGVFRRKAQLIETSVSSSSIPTVTDDLDASFVDESADEEVPESDIGLGNVKWQLRTLASRTRVSFQLERDSLISIAALVMRKMAYAMSRTEDRCGFIGDGTSKYGGIQGVLHKLAQAAHAGSVKTAGSGETTYGTLKIDTILGALGMLPDYSDDGGVEFYLSRPGYFATFSRLKQSASGNLSAGNTAVIVGGKMEFVWNGYTITISHTMPKALSGTNGEMGLFVGNLNQGALMASDPQLIMARLAERYMDKGQIGYVAFHRFDINVHQCGTATEAGSLVGIKFAGS